MEDHPEIKPVFRSEVNAALQQKRTTHAHFTKYEYTSLLAIRAQQLAEGAPPRISLEGMNQADPQFVWKAAKREIEMGALPYIIRRQMPDGTAEFWNAQELSIIW